MSKLKVMYFSAPWCGPCKMFKPAFNEVVEKFDDIDVVNINIDENQQPAVDYAVRSIPTVVLVKEDKEVFRNVGVMSKVALEETITKFK